jgi:hypothetical protein
MTIILDGTTGITSPNDSTGNQSYTGTLTGGTGIVNLGSGQFYKDVTGKIGIGTTSPYWQLSVSDGTVNGGMVPDGGNFYLGTKSNHPILIRTNDTDKVAIDTSGNVGIGTNSPAALLEVKGTAPGVVVNGTSTTAFRGFSIRTNGNEIASMFAEPASGENRITAGFSGFGGYQTMYTNGLERMRISSTGNVGIGITVPDTKLHVYQNTANTPVAAKVQQASSGNFFDYASLGVTAVGASGGLTAWSTGSARAGQIWLSTDASYPLIFATNDTERMRIDSSGNLGIGTSNPSGYGKLVSITTNQTAAFFQSNSGTTQQAIFTANNGTNGGYFSIAGIGTTSIVPTWANGSLALEGVPFSTGNTILSSYTGALIFQTGARLERVRIAYDGTLFAGSGAGSVGPGMSGQFFVGSPSSGGRQVSIDCSGGSVQIQGNSGGWATGMYFIGSSGTYRGGFGALGGGDGFSYYWVGQGYTGTGVQLAYGGNSWAALSDARDKNVVGTIENALEKVSKIRPVYYKYKTDSEEQERRVGFIAQEVQAVLPEAVVEFQKELDNPTEDTKRLSLAYTETIPLLLAAIQELNAKVDSLKQQLGK